MGLMPWDVYSQSIFGTGYNQDLYTIDINSFLCECETTIIGNAGMENAGLATCPDGNLFGLNSLLQQYNTSTGLATEILEHPGGLPSLEGIHCYGDSLFYFTQSNAPGMLYTVDAATGVITALGNIGHGIQGELTTHDGKLYGSISWSPATNFMNGIVEIDPADPGNSTVVVTYPNNNGYDGITASPFCHMLFASNLTDGLLYTIHLLDGAVTPVCAVPADLWRVSSMLEHMTSTICENDIDLDCNNSTSTPDPDFSGPTYDCFSEGAAITDEDIRMWYTAEIATMRVQIVGYMPDAPLEILEVTSMNPALDIVGQNTGTVTLVNLGSATATDFKLALRSILYHNLAAPVTAGMRTIDIQFTNNDGESSNVATAYIDVLFNDVLEVDLGADIIMCEGENQVLNAGNPGAEYLWSTGESTPLITVDEEGAYSVTVNDGILCPAFDTVWVEVLPAISVQLNAPEGACDGDIIAVEVSTDAPFPVDIAISVMPGDDIFLEDVLGLASFDLTVAETTTITIEEVTPSEDVCSIFQGEPIVVDFWPTYTQSVVLDVCEGDSLWINGEWIFTDGIYEEVFSSTFQCDSSVTYNISFVPAEEIWISSFTCVLSEAGVTMSWVPNPDGCYFQVYNEVQYIPPDTTLLFLSTCDESSSGSFQEWTTNQFGCDSVIITTVNWIPGDSTFLFEFTCDIQEVGTEIAYLSGAEGCDSIVITEIQWLVPDTTFVTNTSCNLQDTGQFISVIVLPDGCDHVLVNTISYAEADTTYVQLMVCDSVQMDTLITLFQDASGCDSLVITTLSYEPPADTTFLYALSCDSTALGIVQHTFTGIDGCDSIVIRTIAFSQADTTYVSGASCIPTEVGVFETLFTDLLGCDSLVISTIAQGIPDTTELFITTCDPSGQGVFEEWLVSARGCDSLIITTIAFSPQDTTFIYDSTCDPAIAGTFITPYINRFGCDSIVAEIVSLLPSDTAFFYSTTCDSSAAGEFIQVFNNQFGCDSTVIQTISLLPGDQTSLSSTTCRTSEAGIFTTILTNQYGCDSIITETITIIPGDTATLDLRTCDPAQVGTIETIYTGQDGCDSVVIESITLYPLPLLRVQSANDYNGFDISCAGGADGGVVAMAIGTSPITYLWSTNEVDQLITGLPAGVYEVSITDGNGCMADGGITLSEPEVFMIGFEVSEPDCFDQQLGSIRIRPNGGVPPYTYSIDGVLFQAVPEFSGLSEGLYQLTAMDANDCSATEIIAIHVPLEVHVELGENQVITLGDSAILEAIVNLPFDSLASILWTDIDGLDCLNCLTRIVAPIITTAYVVSVTSVDGCAESDSLTVSVNTNQKIYIPNIFSPNGDGINDLLPIIISGSVEEIRAFSIFDRWGNLVFLANHVLPTDTPVAWDGKWNGEMLNPGVYTYKLVVVNSNGEPEVKYGDITLVR